MTDEPPFPLDEPQPGTRQDAARRRIGIVIDQRAQQIDPAGRNRQNKNEAQFELPAAIDPRGTDLHTPSARAPGEGNLSDPDAQDPTT